MYGSFFLLIVYKIVFVNTWWLRYGYRFTLALVVYCISPNLKARIGPLVRIRVFS